ncbi:hypothetical protein TH63_05040 [Rufibacter radiotolerans]|uniref:VLRF1 domain-containing protein n=1 Tax=Rufibacter radiotolerans TaxID=1379910 RepID=A0A0H4VN29_9BACT|nr:hypothetical protein [Rufibacter radiotolerans]AKQ45144.1 hypothetical protein TH63_05040 [Rufibacter radiotolerans]
MNRFLSRETSAHLLQKILAGAVPYAYDQEKHRVLLLDAAGNEQVIFRLPIVFPAVGGKEDAPVHYVLLLIQAGNCAVGYFEDGVNLDHKVFRSYMVRKKQGKSQIKYLKTKGKSRAGSRVRLGETLEFFENINERLQTYFEDHTVHRVAISCSKTLLPYLYDAKVSTPFDKRDERLFKIPMHVHTPIYDVMMDVHKFLLKGELIYEPTHQDLVNELLGEKNLPDEDESEDGDR